jgi:Protein of unknown function (DUF2938)
LALILDGALIGVIATVFLDLWAAIAKHIFGLPTANWAMVGRWFGHMPRGILRHYPISDAPPIRNELALGWIGHYVIGVLYALAYLYLVQALLSREPSFASAFVFGLATLFAPWLIMQPAMGAGVFASRTPHPVVTRLTNLTMHAVFGASLYLGWVLTR